MNKALILLLLVLGLGCSKPKVSTQIIEIETLKASQLFSLDAVTKYMQTHKGNNRELAKHYSELAAKEKTNNPTKSIYYLKRAISVYPQLDIYQKLAAELMNGKRYKDSWEAYHFLTSEYTDEVNGVNQLRYVFEQPDNALFFDEQVAGILAYPLFYNVLQAFHTEESKDYNAQQKKFLADKRVLEQPDSAAYKMILKVNEYLANTEDGDEKFKNLYTIVLKEKTSKFTIDQSNINKFNYVPFQQEMDDDENLTVESPPIYREFLAETQKDPEFWSYFNFNYHTPISDSVLAITYSVDSSSKGCPKEMRHIYYRLATYTKKGKLIDSRVVAWQSGEKLATMSLDGGIIVVTEYKRIWKNPYEKADFDNSLLSTEENDKKTYAINPDGKIKEIKASL